MNETEVVFGVPFIAHHDAPEVLKPRKQALDFPTPTVAAQLPAVLRFRFLSVLAMWGDQFDALRSKRSVVFIAVISFVADETLWRLRSEASLKRRCK